MSLELLDVAKKAIDKLYGEGALIRLGDTPDKNIPHIPTGIYSLDNHVLGIGGIPTGRLIEIFGPESGGKTTLLSTIIASAQKSVPDKYCAIIDVEQTYDKFWAIKNQVDVENLYFSQPQTGEEAIDIMERLVETEQFSIIGLDSIANLVCSAELDGDVSDATIGLQARLMAKACRRLTGIVKKTNTTIIFLNQIRANIGVNSPYAPKTVTTGGKSLRFYASVRLSVARISSVKENDVALANKIKIKAEKCKVSPPFRETEIELSFDSGIDKELDLVNCAINAKVIRQSGSWFSFNNEKIGQGKDSVKEWLKSNKDTIMGELNNAPI